VIDRRVWLSRRAIGLHVVILIIVPVFGALCDWQVHRALSGNGLSWAYVFEWPFFAGYAVYMWWRFVHDVPEAEAASGAPASPPVARPPAPVDPELAAYNEYLAELSAHGKPKQWRTKEDAPGGGLEPPTSGSKGRRSAD
jgi:hypothetical protein